MKNRILVIEDDIDFLNLVVDFLKSEKYEVFDCFNADSFKETVNNFAPDLILMDRNLPGGVDGLESVKDLRLENNETPVIFISALINEEEVIEGLGIFNCEYLKKPFGLQELKMRIERVLKYFESEKNYFSTKCYVEESCSVQSGNKLIGLTKNENELLKLLIENQDKICKTEKIIYQIWGDKDIERLNRLDVLINKLREKIKDTPFIIENHKRIGYVFKKRN